ncbi:hypothetical protein BD560DRAFT_421743 [Blakeslea trispora]|nr:hypothetical protein BD560DRAFT_421743 [Blakeslea trispora]
MILRYTQQDNIKHEWLTHLILIQFVYNNTVHVSTNHTPFFLTHGRHPRTPLVLSEQQKIFDHHYSPSQEFAIQLQDRLNQAFELVDSLYKANVYQPKQKYQDGQKVLLLDQSLSTRNKPRKLKFD